MVSQATLWDETTDCHAPSVFNYAVSRVCVPGRAAVISITSAVGSFTVTSRSGMSLIGAGFYLAFDIKRMYQRRFPTTDFDRFAYYIALPPACVYVAWREANKLARVSRLDHQRPEPMNVNSDTHSSASYWTGPFGVRVPIDRKRAPASDGVNDVIHLGNGNTTQTELHGPLGRRMDENQYKNRHCEQRADGHWWLR